MGGRIRLKGGGQTGASKAHRTLINKYALVVRHQSPIVFRHQMKEVLMHLLLCSHQVHHTSTVLKHFKTQSESVFNFVKKRRNTCTNDVFSAFLTNKKKSYTLCSHLIGLAGLRKCLISGSQKYPIETSIFV